MIARAHILLPFVLSVPENEIFTIYEYELEGYKVRQYPPQRSESVNTTQGQEVFMGETKVLQSDILWIDFVKDEFKRDKPVECDPPFEIIGRAANDFIERLRYVTKSTHVRKIDFPLVSWNLSYLNNDETEINEEKGKVRGRGGRAFAFSWTALNKQVWENIHELPPGWEAPIWQKLLLDANGSLPNIGTSLVLAATALEVFIAQTLDSLSEKHGIPEQLWSWINSRDWIKKPSPEEQYDFLLKQLLGKSLKEKSDLWESFKNLKNARNSFVHDGIAKIGNVEVSLNQTKHLIARASEIIEFIKEELPEELRWPEFEHKFNVTFRQMLYQQEEENK